MATTSAGTIIARVIIRTMGIAIIAAIATAVITTRISGWGCIFGFRVDRASLAHAGHSRDKDLSSPRGRHLVQFPS